MGLQVFEDGGVVVVDREVLDPRVGAVGDGDCVGEPRVVGAPVVRCKFSVLGAVALASERDV